MEPKKLSDLKLSDLDLVANDSPKCPFCGFDDSDFLTECHEVQYDGDESTNECPKCGKEYHVTLSVSYTFTTEKIEPEDGKK